jgi:catechol 2,3-dioxygenase-like lactoylglutathione lyase family enzyme
MITSGLVTVYVTDMERAIDFYTKTLGLELAYRGGPSWAVVRAPDGFGVGLHQTMEGAEAGTSGSTTLGFRVEGDLADVVEDLRSKGVTFVTDITEETAVPLAYFEDPDGNVMYVVEARGGHG